MKAERSGAARPPEQELLLGACRVDDSQAGRLRRLCQDGLDWNRVRALAIAQGVLPLLYRRLNGMEAAAPAGELDGLRRLYQANARRNLRLMRQLFQVLDLFAAHGLAARPFKGLALAAQAYGDPDLRHFTDLDLLIQRQDFPAVYALLNSAGYRPAYPLQPQWLERFCRSDKHLPFTGGEAVLEIHWAPAGENSGLALDIRPFWETCQPVALANRSIPASTPECTALLLCIHGAKHCWGQLKWIADLAHLLQRQPGLDWDASLRQARAAGAGRLVYTGLLLAEQLGGAALPPELSAQASADRAAQRLADQVQRQLFHVSGDPSYVEKAAFFLAAQERLGRRLAYLAGFGLDLTVTPQPADWLAVPLPQALYPLYYLIRPARLLARSGRRLLGRR